MLANFTNPCRKLTTGT